MANKVLLFYLFVVLFSLCLSPCLCSTPGRARA